MSDGEGDTLVADERTDGRTAPFPFGIPNGRPRPIPKSRAHNELSATVHVLVTDVAVRAAQSRDLGLVRLVRLVECSGAALAALIAADRKLR
ncbi:hypothetical protein [Frankia sp. Cas3]|uniref:hypothetical protein n=1 Tax=Frankia sp. Cas3 TaxID=3073926 RepID=UPI002AD551CC|nr:hypothetical protein [Frankia sp. Cas3]